MNIIHELGKKSTVDKITDKLYNNKMLNRREEMNTKLLDALNGDEELKVIQEELMVKAKELSVLIAKSSRQMQFNVKQSGNQEVGDAVVVKMVADQLYQDLVVMAMDELNSNWREEAMQELQKAIMRAMTPVAEPESEVEPAKWDNNRILH